MKWQPVEVLFPGPSGVQPLDEDRPGVPTSAVAAESPDDKAPQRCWIDDVSLARIDGTDMAAAPVIRWLVVPNQPGLRFADIELALGDGVEAEDASVGFYRDGVALRRVAFHDQLQSDTAFAFSGRTRRVYVAESAAHGRCELRFRPRINPDAGAYLNLTEPNCVACPAGGQDRAWSASR